MSAFTKGSLVNLMLEIKEKCLLIAKRINDREQEYQEKDYEDRVYLEIDSAAREIKRLNILIMKKVDDYETDSILFP